MEIVLTEYDPTWPDQFRIIGNHIRENVGAYVQRIDHIGSTAVVGMKSKNIIDVQITVNDLGDKSIIHDLHDSGYRVNRQIRIDNFIGLPEDDKGLEKIYAREGKGQKRIHIHIREQGRFNQRYALLFRDYIRAHPEAQIAYELMKVRIQKIFPSNIDGYLHLKDPLMDIIYIAATHWAKLTNWEADDQFV